MEHTNFYKGEMRVSVKIETWHSCGQVQEAILTLKMDEQFSLNESFTMPPLSLGRERFTIPPRTLPMLILNGHVERVEGTGLDMSLTGLFCVKCGANLWEEPRE